MRVYEIFATGGIPMLPTSLKSTYNNLDDIFPHDIHYYNINDLFSPGDMIQEAINKFDNHSSEGILRRIKIGLSNHGSVRVSSIVSHLMKNLKPEFI
jgi:hypothetical protein